MLLLLIIINKIYIRLCQIFSSKLSYFAGSLKRETWRICGGPDGVTGHSSCRTDWTDRLDGGVTSFPMHFQDPRETPQDYTIEPLRLRLPYIYTLPGTFDCTRSGLRTRRAYWSILWDPFHSADRSNRIGPQPDLNTNNPFCWRVCFCASLITG